MIDIVGESDIDSEKFAVNVTTSDFANKLSESLSVKVTVGDVCPWIYCDLTHSITKQIKDRNDFFFIIYLK